MAKSAFAEGLIVAAVEVVDEVAEQAELHEDVGAVVEGLVDLGGLGVFDVGFDAEGNEGLGLGLDEGEGVGVEQLLLRVELGVALDGVVVHEGERTGVAGGVPSSLRGGVPAPIEGDLPLGVGVITEGPERDHVLLHLPLVGGDVVSVGDDPLAALFDFAANVLAGLGDDVVVVDALDAGLDAESDEEADGDGGDVEEEVAPAVDGLVGWVDVEHGGGLLGEGSG